MPERAVDELSLGVAVDDSNRGESSLLLAVGYSRIGDARRATEYMRDAFVFSVSAADAALECEVEFYRGLLACGNGELEKAEAACRRAFEVARLRPENASRVGHVPIEHVLARTEELLAITSIAAGDYARSQRYVRTSLATLDGCVTKDAYQEAFALKNLAILASDFDVTEDANMLAARVPAFPWSADIARAKFVAFESLGWCSAIGGDVPTALRHFREAASVADTIPERIHIAVDRAQIAREVGYRGMAVEEACYALNLASAYAWDRASDEFRQVLLQLAQVATSVAPDRARHMLDTYVRTKSRVGTAESGLERRFQAEEAFTHGIVLRAEGRIAASSERLEAAFTIWTRIGFRWRAARAALELTELDAGDCFRLAVRQDLAHRPASIFAERARLVA